MPPLYIAAYDGSSSGRAAVRLAMSLAAESPAEVVAAHVATDLEPDEAAGLLDDLRRELDDAIGGRVVRAASAAAGLHALAAREDAALLVVGPHRGPSGRRTGSTARALLNGAPCPVAVAPRLDPSYEHPLGRVAVGYDGSEESDVALGAAARLAGFLEADVTVLAVEEGSPVEAALDAAAARLRREGLPVDTRLLRGDGGVAAQLVAACRFGVDLLVVGSRPGGPPGTVVADSVAGQVADDAPCPVLVVPLGARRVAASAGR